MRIRNLTTAAIVAALAALTVAISAQSTPSQPPRPVFVDGQAQIVPAFQDAAQWVKQTLWVETEFDSDRPVPARSVRQRRRPRHTPITRIPTPLS